MYLTKYVTHCKTLTQKYKMLVYRLISRFNNLHNYQLSKNKYL